MKLTSILELARQGRPDLAAINLGVGGYSYRGLNLLLRYSHSSGQRFSGRHLFKLWHSYRWKRTL